MKLQDVILRAIAKKITWLDAAEIAGLSPRTVNRIWQRYQDAGYDGLYDQQRRKRFVHRVPLPTAERVLALYQQSYSGLTPRRFHQKLASEHEIRLSYSWVRQALEGAGLVALPRKAVEAPRVRQIAQPRRRRLHFVRSGSLQ